MNLKEKPFYLNDTDVEWVNKTVESLTDDEKIGQLFLASWDIQAEKGIFR